MEALIRNFIMILNNVQEALGCRSDTTKLILLIIPNFILYYRNFILYYRKVLNEKIFYYSFGKLSR